MSRKSKISLSNRALFYQSRKETLQQDKELHESEKGLQSKPSSLRSLDLSLSLSLAEEVQNQPLSEGENSDPLLEDLSSFEVQLREMKVSVQDLQEDISSFEVQLREMKMSVQDLENDKLAVLDFQTQGDQLHLLYKALLEIENRSPLESIYTELILQDLENQKLAVKELDFQTQTLAVLDFQTQGDQLDLVYSALLEDLSSFEVQLRDMNLSRLALENDKLAVVILQNVWSQLDLVESTLFRSRFSLELLSPELKVILQDLENRRLDLLYFPNFQNQGGQLDLVDSDVLDLLRNPLKNRSSLEFLSRYTELILQSLENQKLAVKELDFQNQENNHHNVSYLGRLPLSEVLSLVSLRELSVKWIKKLSSRVPPKFALIFSFSTIFLFAGLASTLQKQNLSVGLVRIISLVVVIYKVIVILIASAFVVPQISITYYDSILRRTRSSGIFHNYMNVKKFVSQFTWVCILYSLLMTVLLYY
jgi:hypothetical protein